VPLRIAVPSPTSRLYPVASKALEELLGKRTPLVGRTLLTSLGDGSLLVYCRGTDVSTLVALGVADIGLTGYDMVAETVAGGRSAPIIRSLAPARTSYVCLLMPEERGHISRIYTEYPNLTRAWLRCSRTFRDADVITVHGSLEGVVALDGQSAGVLLVTSGETANANGLDRCVPLLATDLCLISYGSAASCFSGIDPKSLTMLELPRFCLEPAALHGLLRRRRTAGTAHAVASPGKGRTAAHRLLHEHAG
jgi:ATP phosphoribosyltransferase